MTKTVFTAYTLLIYDMSKTSTLAFWKTNERSFPMLAVLAKRYLTQSASSVAVENMFSTTGIIVNGKRSTLAPHRLNWLTFIHDNYPLYFDMGPSGN
jgi:hAT family C-terminal dimerisation region